MDKYGVILANTACKKGLGLTVEYLEEAMKIQWQIVQGNKTSSGVENKEFILVGFSGTCYHCGEKGHRENKCKKNKMEETNRAIIKMKGTNQNSLGSVKPVEKWAISPRSVGMMRGTKKKGQIGGKSMDKPEQRR